MPSVVFEPILRGAKPMRGGADPTPPCTAHTTINGIDVPAWQWHMKADIAHDGGAAILGYTSMNLAAVYGGQNTKTGLRAPWDMLPLDEDVVRDKLLASDLYKDRAGRPSVHFLLRPATDQFTDEEGKSIVFDPFQGQAVAVYHDAGLPMNTRIPNARNGRSYGQAIDPAPKPVGDDDFIDQVVGSFAIPGCTFGFDPRIVGDIVVSNFNGTQVRVGIRMNIPGIVPAGMTLYDAATGRVVQAEPQLTFKVINKPTGLFAGNGANGRMTGSPRDIPYFIGKAICDAIQVAALMPKLWTQGGEEIAQNLQPMIRILNTGDRLEYVRTVLLGVSCIYLGPKDGETKARTGVFTPGSDVIKTDAQLKTEYNTKLKGIYASACKRWQECVDSIKRAILADGSFNVAYSYFGGVSYVDMGNPAQVASATAFMENCKNVIEETCEAIVGLGEDSVGKDVDHIAEGGYFGSTIAATLEVESVADKIAAYSQLLSELDSHCPPGAILRRANMPQVFRVSSTETTEVTIKFLKGFEAIKKGLSWEPALVVKGYPDVAEGGARPKNYPRSRPADPYKNAAAAKQAERLASTRRRVDRYAKASPTCVKLVNAFTCLVNVEQSRILGIRFTPTGAPTVYRKPESELANEWTELFEIYKGEADLSTLEQFRVEISAEVEAGYGDPEYAIGAGVIARVVADEKNQNDFTEFVKFLFSDLTYPAPHKIQNVEVVGDPRLLFEDRGIVFEEKQTFKAVRSAFMVLRLAVGFNMIDPMFYDELYSQAVLLMSIAPMPPEDDNEFGGSRRKTHRRRLPKLI